MNSANINVQPSPINVMNEYKDTGKINNTSQEFGLMITLQENLNIRLGTERWRKRITSIFWHYVSTPINFTITLFTAITSGQVGTGSTFLSEGSLFALLFTTFLLSTINTFFKLKETTVTNYEISQKIDEFAIKFQEIYYTPINSDRNVYKRYIDYKHLQHELNEYFKSNGIDSISYLTELLYSCCQYTCLKRKIKLITSAERIWVLDGKKKNNIYNKKFIRIDMSNFELDTQKIDEDDLDKCDINKLKSPDYKHISKPREGSYFFTRKRTKSVDTFSDDSYPTQSLENAIIPSKQTNDVFGPVMETNV